MTQQSDDASEAPHATRRPSRRAWWPLGRVRGIAFFVSPTLLLVAVMLLILPDGAPVGERLWLMGLLLLSVLVHELGHALAARLVGLQVGGVYLHLVSFASIGPGGPVARCMAALGGPGASALAAGLGLAGLALGGGVPDRLEGFLHEPLPIWVLINGLMASVNLIPALPLDGGRALEALAADAPGRRRALHMGGMVVGAALIVSAPVLLDWPVSGVPVLFGAGLVAHNAWALKPRGR